jgi:hypothetical protein
MCRGRTIRADEKFLNAHCAMSFYHRNMTKSLDQVLRVKIGRGTPFFAVVFALSLPPPFNYRTTILLVFLSVKQAKPAYPS